MLLLPGSHMSVYDNKRFVINTNTGRNLLVNEATAQMFSSLQSAQHIEQAWLHFNQKFNASISLVFFENLLIEHFGGYGILAQESGVAKPLPADYIRLKVELFSTKLAANFAKPLKHLYSPWIFWTTLIATLSFLLALHLSYPVVHFPPQSSYWVAIPLIYASIFIHEFGHIAACSKFNIRHGGIGFGFYLFLFPVLYADVTNIWQAGKQYRIITNLGGIFSQTLYALLLGIIYLGTHITPLLYASMAITISALWQLNPFVRHDGYWLLSDLTNTPNLLTKASQTLNKALSWKACVHLYQSRGHKLSVENIFLFSYGLINSTIIFAFAYFYVSRHGEQLIELPTTLYHMCIKLARHRLTFQDLRDFPLIAVTFYIVAIRQIIMLTVKWKYKLTVNTPTIKPISQGI